MPDDVIRWLRPLAPLVMLVVLGAGVLTEPRPGLEGRHLVVLLALVAFLGTGVWAEVTLGRDSHLWPVLGVLVASGVLAVAQPEGAGIAGLFVGASLLVPILRGRAVAPVAVGGLVLIGVAIVTGGPDSIVDGLLNAIMLASFFGVMFLAVRLAEANELTARLTAQLERQRLAREMHDGLGHSLAGMMLQLEGARMLTKTPEDPRLPQAVDRAHRLGRAALEEARRAVGFLRDDELPGLEQIPELVERFEADHDIPTTYTTDNRISSGTAETGLALYRVVQEALTNVAKHAHAERVQVELAHGPDRITLRVEDFGESAAPGRPGFGIAGMRERAELLGGELLAVPTAGGFRVSLWLPR